MSCLSFIKSCKKGILTYHLFILNNENKICIRLYYTYIFEFKFYFTIVTINRHIIVRNLNKIKFFTAFFFLASIISGGYAQTYFGFKAGANATKPSFSDEDYKKFYDTKIKPGYTAGAVFLIQTKEKFGLYTELLYAVKGKSVESRANDYATHKANYQYIDFPVMFRMKFEQPQFNWFIQFGPEASYWLGGSGVMEVYERDRDIFIEHAYKINFGEPETTSEYLNVAEANRIQLGLTAGGGLVWDLNKANYIMFDIRFSYGQSFLGGFESGSIPNVGLVDNFEHTNNVLTVSAVYYFDIMEKLRLSKNKY